MTQSLTSQMIDGVFPPGKTPDLSKLTKRDGPLKVCFECYYAWPNAQKFCNNCGYQFYGVERKCFLATEDGEFNGNDERNLGIYGEAGPHEK